jgi:hypothetical protein
MTSYILAPEALQDLQELWDYIARENLDAPLRFWTVDAYLVIYHAERTPLRLWR